MIHDEIAGFAAALPPRTAIMGLDLGTRTIGTAVSDILRGIATPQHTIRRRKFTLDAADLLSLAADRAIGGIVLGHLLRFLQPKTSAFSSAFFCRNFSTFFRLFLLLGFLGQLHKNAY